MDRSHDQPHMFTAMIGDHVNNGYVLIAIRGYLDAQTIATTIRVLANASEGRKITAEFRENDLLQEYRFTFTPKDQE